MKQWLVVGGKAACSHRLIMQICLHNANVLVAVDF